MSEHYLDNSATTQVLRPVAERALELMVEEYGNPSSLHTRGFRARQQVEEARALVAQRLGAQPEEVFFTSGGTEANNLALVGAAQARRRSTIPSSTPATSCSVRASRWCTCSPMERATCRNRLWQTPLTAAPSW